MSFSRPFRSKVRGPVQQVFKFLWFRGLLILLQSSNYIAIMHDCVGFHNHKMLLVLNLQKIFYLA